MTHKSYICGILFLSGIVIIFVATFNWFFDPYGIWDSPKFKRVNEYIYNSGHERLYKMISVARKDKISTLFMGASTVKKALYPKTYCELYGTEVYNSGFDAAHILEMKYILEQTIMFHPELQEVVLCLNFFQFDLSFNGTAKDFPVDQLGYRNLVIKEMLPRLLSKDSIRHSIRVVWMNYYNVIHCSLFDEDGKMNPFWLLKEYEESNNIEEFSRDTIAQIPIFKEFSISNSTKENYREIVKLCEDNDINLIVYINPVHNIFLESIYASGSGDIFEEWKRWLVTVHPVYDFAHYSKVGNEPFSLRRRYWRNTQHSMPLTGDMVLWRLAGRKMPEDVGEFGVYLTENNVAKILENERELRSIWKEDNPEIVNWVENLVKCY